METRAHYVAVGAFVLAMIFLGFVGVLYFGAVQPSAKYSSYDIFFRGAVTGLSKGAIVEYNGIPVGKVSDIEIDPKDVEQIRVTVDIESKVVIKADAKAEIQSNLLSGVSFILISRGTQEAASLVAKPGDRYPVIASRRSALASVYARGPELMEKLNDIADDLKQTFSEQNRKSITDILTNVRTISADFAAHDKDVTDLFANANVALAELSKLLGHVDTSYIDPDGLKDRLSRTLGDADEASKEIRLTVHDARAVVQQVNAHTIGEVNELLRETRLFIAGLARLAGEIERDPSKLLYGDRREGYRPR